MARKSTLVGTLVCAPPESEYDFEDDNGKRIEGTTRIVWVVYDASDHPVMLKFRNEDAADYGKACGLVGKQITCLTVPQTVAGAKQAVETFVAWG